MKISNNLYDVLKDIAATVLPATATLYITLAGIWDLPYGKAISGTIMAVDAFLGVLLHMSTKKYNADVIADEEGDE